MSYVDFEPRSRPQPRTPQSFSEYWQNPVPDGAVASVKRLLNIPFDMINASIAATRAPPSTEEEIFLYNLARERGIRSAFEAASTFSPAAPRFVSAVIPRFRAASPVPERLPSGHTPSAPGLPPPGRALPGRPSSPGSVPLVPPPAAGAGPTGGLLARLQELDALERAGSAIRAGVSAAEKNPNFRQLSRFPVSEVVREAGAVAGHYLDISDALRAPGLPAPGPAVRADAYQSPSTSSRGGGSGSGGRGGGGDGDDNPKRTFKDDCDEQEGDESRKCETYKDDVAYPDYYWACKRRAKDRWRYCYENSGSYVGGPLEWRPGTDKRPGDEETWRNYDR